MNEVTKRKEALRRAVELVGGQSALARALDVGQPRVNNWINRDQQGVAAEFCVEIERLTAGAVTRFELRPDIFGQPPGEIEDKAA